MRTDSGFTLVELMLTIAIIGILASIVIPQFSDLMRKSQEAATKGNLGAMRSAISIYYGDTDGQLPTDNLASLTASGKYLNKIYPTYVRPWHQPGNTVGGGNFAAFMASDADVTNWWYYSDPDEPRYGLVIVNCIHTDLKGTVWTSY